jgi:hypothetical protein
MSGSNEIHQLTESDLAHASGGWGALAGLAGALAGGRGNANNGTEIKNNVVLVAPLIG